MKKYIFLIEVFLIALIFSGCFLISSHPSSTVQLISPENGSTDVSTDVTLTWQVSGAQPSEYEIFLGTTDNPSIFATSSKTQIEISNLSYSTLYYWKVETIPQNYGSAGQNTNQNIAVSQLWNFVTEPSSQSYITLVMGTIPATIGGNQNFSFTAVVYHKFALEAATATIGSVSVSAANLDSSSLTFDFGSNLKPLKSGLYNLYISVKDVNGNTVSGHKSLYIDNSSPLINFITVPATVESGQTETVSVMATAIGNGDSISSVEIGGIQAVQSSLNPYVWTASITFEGTGIQTLYATATDILNNVSAISKHVMFMLSVIIPDTTEVLNQSTIQHLTYVSTNQSVFIFTKGSSQVTNLKPGDVIVSSVNNYIPYGALRKIVSINNNPSNNTITVYTTSTTLNQAIQQGNIYCNTVLTPNQIASETSLAKNVKVIPVTNAHSNSQNSSDYSETFKYEISYQLATSSTDTNLNVTATGYISFTLGFDFGVNISLFGNSAYFTVNQSEQSSLQLSANFSYSLDITQPIYTIYFDPIVVFVGPVPVVINPYAIIYVGANGKLSVGLTAGITQQENFKLGEQYSNNSWSPIDEFENSLNCSSPAVQTQCKFTGDISPQVGIQLYWGLGSLFIQPEAYLTFDAQYYQQFTNNSIGWLWWNLYGGLQATVGANVAWGLASYDSPPLFNYSIMILQSTPSLPIVTVSSTSEKGVTLSWKELSPNVDGFNILRSYDGQPFTDIATLSSNIITYTDSSITKSGNYEYKVSAYNSDLLGINVAVSNVVNVTIPYVQPVLYSISGYVDDVNGNGIPGVMISFSNNATSSVTDDNGYWTKNQLSGTVVVTPSLSGYGFDPSSTSVDGTSSNVDFIGIPSAINSAIILQGFCGQGSTPVSTSQWPSLLTGQSAQAYWSPVEANDSQQVLELVGNGQNYDFWSAGTAIFSSYYNGNSLTVNASCVYTTTSGWLADGYEVGLFMTPNNYISLSGAVAYWTSSTEFSGQSYLFNTNPPQGVFGCLTSTELQGDIMFPYSPTPYIMVQWDPVYSTGQFDIFIVSYSSPSEVPNFVTYSNIGNSGFQPNPGDILNMNVSYSANTNSINTSMVDMNTSQMATLTITLPNTFSPPQAGNYSLSIAGNSGDGSANWGLLNLSALTGTTSTFRYTLSH